MKKTVILIIAVLGIARIHSEGSVISYTDYMAHIRSSLPQIQSARLESRIAEANYKKEKGVADLNLSAGSAYRYDEPAGQGNVESSSGINSTVGVSKKFTSSGTTLSGELGYGSTNYSAAPENYSAYTPSVSVSLRQPVLKNFFGYLDRYPLKNAALQYEIAKLSQESQIESLEYEYSYLYMEWCAYKRILDLGKNNVSNSYTTYKQTRRKLESRLAENDDVQKSYSSYLSYKISDSTNQKFYSSVHTSISEIVSVEDRNPDISSFETEYAKARDFEYQGLPFEKSRECSLLQKQLETGKLSVSASENSLLPSLDIIAAAGRKDSTDDFGESMTALEKSEYSIGFEMTYPLGNTGAKYSKQSSELQLEKLAKQLQEDKNNFNARMNYILEAVQKTKETISFQALQLKSLRSQLATENTKYAQARLSLSTLLDTKSKIANTEASLIRSKLELISLYYSYKQMVL